MIAFWKLFEIYFVSISLEAARSLGSLRSAKGMAVTSDKS